MFPLIKTFTKVRTTTQKKHAQNGAIKNANEILVKTSSGVTRSVDENIDQFIIFYEKIRYAGYTGSLNTSIGCE
jgi:hypothetical protein